MPAKNRDLHGNVPDQCKVALLLIDVINRMEFDGSEDLLSFFMPAAKRIADLKTRARAAGIPAIFVNDNFGRWQSDFRAILERCLRSDSKGRPIAELLSPEDDDYFVLKPKHSGFFSTTLDTLLRYLGAETLVITGVAGNICILFTANDAFLRDYHIVVPSDCVASNTAADNEYALRQVRTVLDGDVRPSTELDLDSLLCGADPRS